MGFITPVFFYHLLLYLSPWIAYQLMLEKVDLYFSVSNLYVGEKNRELKARLHENKILEVSELKLS